MQNMKFLGYTAHIEYSDEDRLFIGQVVGIRERIVFYGESVSELKESFEHAVRDYLKNCRLSYHEPERPFSGQISLRIEPRLHARMAYQAEHENKSLNQWVVERLESLL